MCSLRSTVSPVVLAFLAIVASAIPPVSAATFNVTKTADTADGACDADCSLREAVIAANANPSLFPHEINLPAGTYRLSLTGDEAIYGASVGDLDIAGWTNISGAGAAITTIDAQHIDRVFEVQETTLSISHVTITGGGPIVSDGLTGLPFSGAFGGGILVAGNLSLYRCVVTGNSVIYAGPALGGGIAGFAGGVVVVDSTITNNSVESPYSRGGGVFVSGSEPGVNSCQLSAEDSVFSDNTASGLNAAGGGVGAGTEIIPGVPASIVDGSVVMHRCTVSGNHAEGGGGGIFLHQPSGTVTRLNEIRDSTVSDNSADGGGGVFTGSPLWMLNATLSGNSATNGGGVFNGGDLTLIHGTLTGNSATSGAVIYNIGSQTLANSILDGACTNAGITVSDGGSLESPGNSCGLGATSDRINVPLGTIGLAPLAGNGGPTLTHALLPSSPAIDDGLNANCLDYLFDQRGVPRPLDGNNNGPKTCDKGAFEFDGIFADDFESGDTSLWSSDVP